MENNNVIEKEQFIIDNDTKANWAIKQLKKIDDERQEFVNFYKTKIEKIEADAESKSQYFNGLLASYLQSESIKPHVTTTTIKYDLPAGELVRRVGTIKYEYDENELLKEFEEKRIGDYIKIYKKVDWKSFKSNLRGNGLGGVFDAETGELYNAIKCEQQADTFKVRFKGSEVE